ncbi:MAG: efflux RND transporter periplasmic adaptor subunit [Acidobacteria bacterium]|nr:efflux RND transporter periplasmic adaptor subunit [Acidobacteriota bacterium]
MKKILLLALVFFLGLVGGKIDWRNLQDRFQPADKEAVSTDSENHRILYWVDPMHPQYKSDKPGKAPDCGMDLVPVYADQEPTQEVPENWIQIPTGKQQLMGVRYGTVTRMPLEETVRTVGRISYDETRITRVHPKIDGWIEKVHVDFTGQFVRKNQPLLEIYSPALVATQNEFLLAARARDSLSQSSFKEISSGSRSLYEAARQRLLLWDVDEATIERIEKTGEIKKALTLFSPVSGFVLERNAYDRQRVTSETELYAIADLSNVWVLADVYEYEMPLLRIGQTAQLDLAYLPGQILQGRVDYIYPQLDPDTRTLKVRIQVPNTGYVLKPDMYVNVTFRAGHGTQVTVPSEAVMDSGTEQIVFVAHDRGFFEPRKVTIGAEVDGYYVVRAGLQPGEKVVTSANFLVDSESRLKAAMGAMAGMGHGGHAPAEPKVPQQKQPETNHRNHTPPPKPQQNPPSEPAGQPRPSPPMEDHSQHGATPSQDHSQPEGKPAKEEPKPNPPSGSEHQGHQGREDHGSHNPR